MFIHQDPLAPHRPKESREVGSPPQQQEQSDSERSPSVTALVNCFEPVPAGTPNSGDLQDEGEPHTLASPGAKGGDIAGFSPTKELLACEMLPMLPGSEGSTLHECCKRLQCTSIHRAHGGATSLSSVLALSRYSGLLYL
ncbi:hypothetical protein EOD39_6787 [Acipenser ruthenus]|uniref:Uncharacterized protein n=1 Tax=Acipenser ruthenus TaxID=7906 RepID=A0A662YXJ9_ACIRT|nr:hypothetical protein EOD39_6787 [Acipenser ruthenus]